jgi:CHAT domain-containing protein/tetratricopeptide (TPR) repeat protein
VVKTYALSSGPDIPRQLGGGQLDAYEIDLTSDQYLHATFDQQGVDLVIDVFAPGHRKLFRIDGTNGAQGPEEVHLVAETSGRYRFEVTTEPGAPAGTYTSRHRALGQPSPKNRSQAAADRSFYEAKEIDGQANRFWEAAAKYERSVRLFQEAGDRWHQAYALLRLGRLHRAQPREALDDLTRAEGLFRTLGDLHFVAATLNEIGTCYKDLVDFERASDAYQHALDLARPTGELQEQATILHNLGNLFQLHGQSWQALGFFRQALALRQREVGAEARTQEANTLTGVGWAYASTGDWQRAIDAHWRALKLRNRLRDPRLISISLTQIGTAWLFVEPHRGLPFLNRARELQRDVESPKDRASTLESLGLAFRLLGRYREAQAAYRQSLEIFRSLHDLNSQAVTLNNLGWAAVYRHQTREALQIFEQGLRLARQSSNPTAEAGALQGMAEAERQRGNLTMAQIRAEDSLKKVESLRAAIPRKDLQTSFLAANISTYGVLIDTLMDRHRERPTGGFDLQAWSRSEQARARALLDSLREARQQRTDLRAHIDPIWIHQRRDLLREIGIQDAHRRSPATTAVDKAAAEQAISQLLDRLSEVDSEVRRARRGKVSAKPLTASIGALQRQIDQGNLLLEYHLGSDRSYLWAVSTEGLQSFELPGTEVLAPLLRSADEQLSGNPTTTGLPDADARLLELSRLLLGPVASQLRGRRLLIAADGLQQYIPFAALPDPIGGHEPLVLHHEIVMVPSLAVLAELRARAAERPPPPGTLAVLADPVFDASDARLGEAGVDQPKIAGEWKDIFLPRLDFARDEAIALGSLVPSNQYFQALDFDASRDLVASGHLSGYRILHFATHAFQLTDQSELSALIFSRFDRQGRPIDGYLRAADLEGLDLSADLVVLSACDTALGRQAPGEELAALPQAFFIAGAQRVLASLWQVEDESTAALMTEFYRCLLVQHFPPARALREAQVAIRSQPRWESPRYWAGFVLIGDWR